MTASPLRRLVGQGSLYAAANLMMKAAGFLLAILYLDPAYLSQAGFGLWGTLDALAKVVTPLLSLGMTVGLLKFWAEPAFEDARDDLALTALATTATTALLCLGVFLLGAPWLGGLLLGAEAPPESPVLMQLVGGLIAARAIQSVPAALIRIRERAGLFLFAIGAEMAVLVGGTYYLLVVRGAGLIGVVGAHLGAAALSALVLTVGLFAPRRARVRLDLVERLIRFGLPLAAAALGTLLLNIGDRFLLLRLTDADTTAVYDWAGRLGGLLYLLFVSSFNAAFSVIGLKTLRGDTTQTGFHQRTFRHFTALMGWAAVGLSLGAYDLTRLISPNPAFLVADDLVPPIALGFLFYGVYFLLVNILYAGDRTDAVVRNVLVATAVNLALNLVLIPWAGALGAALATLLAYGALLALTARDVRHVSGTPFAWGRLGAVVGLVAVLVLAGQPSTDWPTAERIALRAALVVAYLPALLLLGVYRWEEVSVAVGRFWRRGG